MTRVYKSAWRKVYDAVCKTDGKTASEHAETLDLRLEFNSGWNRPKEHTFTTVATKLEKAGLIRGVREEGGARWYRQGRVVGKEELARAWERFGAYSPFL